MGRSPGRCVALRQSGRFYASAGFKRLASITAALQFIIACSGLGSGDPPVDLPPDEPMAGRAGGGNTASEAGTPSEPGSAAGTGAFSDAGAADAPGAAGDSNVMAGMSGAGGTFTNPSRAGTGGDVDPFVPAARAPYPLVTAHGGPVLQNAELVPIYFGADPLLPQLEDFNSWIVSSDYWRTVGAEYGVLPGTRLPSVQFANPPMSPISDLQIASWLDDQIANGLLPKPSSQTIFALFYPVGTKIITEGLASCFNFAGLHRAASINNSVFTGEVAFAVIPRCSFSPGDELMIATDVASHEYMEAATDPFFKTNVAWRMDNGPGPLEAWRMLSGNEVADLCLSQSYDMIDGFAVNDIWSNVAAQAGNNPCQPSDPDRPFFSVSSDETIYHASPGTTLTIHARAWSNKPAPDWELSVNWGLVPASNFDGQATLSKTIVNNGDDVSAAVTIPANPPMVGGRSVYRFTIDSIDPINPNFAHPWPFLVIVP